jgi:hypothetical protein
MAEWARSSLPYPVQVTKWLREPSDLDSIVAFLNQADVSCAIFHRRLQGCIKYAVFRVRLFGDPEDIEDQSKEPLPIWREYIADKVEAKP